MRIDRSQAHGTNRSPMMLGQEPVSMNIGDILKKFGSSLSNPDTLQFSVLKREAVWRGEEVEWAT